MNASVTKDQADKLKKRLLDPDFKVKEAPVKIRGSLSYVEQTPWIRNQTFMDNVLFGEEFDQDRYDKVIKAC